MVNLTFGQKLKYLREENDLTLSEVGMMINNRFGKAITKSMLSKWENEVVASPRYQDIKMVAIIFGVTTDYLLGLSEVKYPVDPNSLTKIPILGSIDAGTPMLAQSDVIGHKYIETDKDLFAMKVNGDSMSGARIYDGDVVFVEKTDLVDDGQIYVVSVDRGEAALRRVCVVDGRTVLHAENPNYPDVLISKKDIKELKILGRVVAVNFSIGG